MYKFNNRLISKHISGDGLRQLPSWAGGALIRPLWARSGASPVIWVLSRPDPRGDCAVRGPAVPGAQSDFFYF